MGRPRKPTALKILEGAQPCRINKDEPKPTGGLGDPPGHLDREARRAWAEIGGPLEELGVLTSADREAFALYLVNRSRWLKANEEIEAEGLVVAGQFGWKPNPHIAISNACAAFMAKFHAHFGMTPGARAALHVQPKPKESKLKAFFAGTAGKKPHGPKAED